MQFSRLCRLGLFSSAPALLLLACVDLEIGGTGLDDDACLTDMDCGPGMACSLAQCVPIDPTGTGPGNECAQDSDCPEGLVCTLSPSSGLLACRPPGMAGDQCREDADCGPGLACILDEMGVLRCVPTEMGDVGDPCSDDTDCNPELVCSLVDGTPVCVPPNPGDIGDPCESPLECKPGLTCNLLQKCVLDDGGTEACGEEAPFRVHTEIPRVELPPRDFFRTPFPNAARVDPFGALHIEDLPRTRRDDIVTRYVNAVLADFDGFSTIAPATFRLSGPLDTRGLADGSLQALVRWVDVTPNSPEFGQFRGVELAYDDQGGRFTCPRMLHVAPKLSRPLRPNTTYAIYITNGIRSTAGEVPGVDPDLSALLAVTEPDDLGLTQAWRAYAPLREHLASAAIAPNTIAGATVFTTQDTRQPMGNLAAAVSRQAPPNLRDMVVCDTGVSSPCAVVGNHCSPAAAGFTEIHGIVEFPMYQTGLTPFERPEDGGKIQSDLSAPSSMAEACFTLTVPKTAIPLRGWPLAVYGHGTGDRATSMVSDGVAAALATQGVAGFSFDAVVHGLRRGGSMKALAELMFNFQNPHAAKGNALQSAVDVLHLSRIPSASQATPIALPGVGATTFDPSHLFYFGHFQGATAGVLALAQSSAYSSAVLAGSPAYVTRAVLDKTQPDDFSAFLEVLLADRVDMFHPVMTLMQTYVDDADPLNHAGHLLLAPHAGISAKHVLMTWTNDDSHAPRSSLDIMARALGLPMIEPIVEPIDGLVSTTRPLSNNFTTSDGPKTAGVFQYATNGAYDGHYVAQRNPAAIADWAAFLGSAARSATSTPTVP